MKEDLGELSAEEILKNKWGFDCTENEIKDFLEVPLMKRFFDTAIDAMETYLKEGTRRLEEVIEPLKEENDRLRKEVVDLERQLDNEGKGYIVDDPF